MEWDTNPCAPGASHLPLPASIDKIMLLGDTHGNERWTCWLIDQAYEAGVDGILQLGDFGYWPRNEWGKSFLKWVEQTLAEHDLPLWFIDGNHEDHDCLKSTVSQPGPLALTDHITYLPRGTRWQWGNRTWIAIGGATSVDRHYRTEGVNWFPGEFMTQEQQDSIIAAGHADIVVAHDAPWGVRFLANHYKLWVPPAERGGWPADTLLDSDSHMRKMAALALALRPSVWFHGHHHIKYDEYGTALEPGTCPMDIHGLNCDGFTPDKSALIVDGKGAIIPWAATSPIGDVSS